MEPELNAKITEALNIARQEQKAAGPGTRGRSLALTVTALEEALLRAKSADHPTLIALA